MTGEADADGRSANESAVMASRAAAVPSNKPEPGARWAGAAMFGIAAAVAAATPLALDGDLTVRTLRETAPLAGGIGAVIGFLVVTRWPRSMGGAVTIGLMSAFVAFVFFSMMYLFGEAVIAAFRSEQAGGAIAAASDRLWDRLPLGILSALVAFSAAGLLLRGIGAGVIALAERRAGRRAERGARRPRRR